MTTANKVISSLLVCVASLLVGCGGGSGGGAAKPANVDPDGFYGFDGIGWAISDNQLSQDGWDKVGSQDGIYVELTANSPSAMAMAQASYDDINSQLGGSTQTAIIFAPQKTPDGRGVWYGWSWFDDFEGTLPNVYEAFLVDGTSGLRIEVSGDRMPKSTAEPIVTSVQFLKPF